jgi:hypothetical protein
MVVYRSRKVLIATIVVVGVTVPAVSAQGSLPHPSVVSDNPANYTPNIIDDTEVPKSSVDALVQIGDTMYAGGAFNSVQDSSRTNTVTRANLMSFDASTGAINDFAPTVDRKVFALASDGSDLFVGGYFSRVNGVFRRGIAKIDPVSGELDRAFNARLKGPVQEIRLVNGRLIVGGKFPQRLLALDPETGADTGYIDIDIEGSVASNAGKTDVYRFAVDPSGTRLVAIGNFTSVDGQARSRAFMLDLNTDSASLSGWYYEPLMNPCRASRLPAYLRDVDFAPDGSYFVVDSTGFVPFSGGLERDLCDAVARFETDELNPTRPTWINYSGGDTFHSIAVTGAAVYVQGHFRYLDNPTYGSVAPTAVERKGVGAIDPTTGLALPWNPGKSRGVGGKDIYVTPTGVWFGSDTPRFAGEFRSDLAFLPLG